MPKKRLMLKGLSKKKMRICNLCESVREVNWTCQECDQTLCNTCKIFHLRVKTSRNHHVLLLERNPDEAGNVPVKEDTDIEYCEEHTSEKLQRYCKNCDISLCIECVFSHHGHTLIKLSEILFEKQRELSDIIKITEKNRLFKTKKSLKEMKEHKEKYVTETENSIEEIKNKAELLKAEVDEIKDNFIKEAKRREQKELNKFNSCIERLETELLDIKKKKQEAENQLATTLEINVLNKEIKNMKTILKNEREITQPSVKSTRFTANKSNKQDIQKLYGSLSTETDKSENKDDNLASDILRQMTTSPVQNFTHVHFKEHSTNCSYTGNVKYIPQLTSNSTLISDICSYGDRALIKSCFQNDNIYSNLKAELKRCKLHYLYIPYFTIIKIVSFDGEVQRIREFETKVIHGMTMNDDELFISDSEHEQILLSKDEISTKFEVFVKTKPYRPYNLCFTESGYLLACLIKTDSRKIVQYTKTARIAQVFEFNDKGQPLFQNPTTITVNKQQNIWIEDSGTVMILDFKGRITFTYTGLNGPNKADLLKKYKLDHKFSPLGMTSNEYGDVLICDYNNSVIHIVDSTGSTVDLIKSDKPRCITNDSRNKCIWITSDECKVSVIKYSMN